MKIIATFAAALASIVFSSISHAQVVSGTTTTYFPVKLAGVLEIQGTNDKVLSIAITTAKVIAGDVALDGTTGDLPKDFALLSDTNNNVSVVRTTGSNSGQILDAIISGTGTSSSTLVSKAKSGALTLRFTAAGKNLFTPQTKNDAGTINIAYAVKENAAGDFTGASASFFGGSPAASGTGTLILPITNVPDGTAYLIKGAYKTGSKAIILPTPVTTGTGL